MKKVFSVLLTLALLVTLPFTTALAKHDSTPNGNNGNKGNNSNKAEITANAEENDAEDEDSNAEEGDSDSEGEESNNGRNKNKNAFKAELNEQKRELQEQKSEVCQQLEKLEAEYEELIASGDTEAAEALLEEINALKEEVDGLQSQIKQTINERHMVVKTMYSEEELAQFENAAALIEQMYADAYTLGAGCITVNNNIIKFEAPPYIKGGVTMVPVSAIAAQLDAEVTWDGETQTVSIVKDTVTIQLTIDSQTVLVDGEAIDVDLSPEISCGRTYAPLRFLAEAFDLAVTWDSENEIIDVDDGTADDGTADDGTADDGTTDDGTTDDGTTDDGTTDDGTADDGTGEAA